MKEHPTKFLFYHIKNSSRSARTYVLVLPEQMKKQNLKSTHVMGNRDNHHNKWLHNSYYHLSCPCNVFDKCISRFGILIINDRRLSFFPNCVRFIRRFACVRSKSRLIADNSMEKRLTFCILGFNFSLHESDFRSRGSARNPNHPIALISNQT